MPLCSTETAGGLTIMCLHINCTRFTSALLLPLRLWLSLQLRGPFAVTCQGRVVQRGCDVVQLRQAPRSDLNLQPEASSPDWTVCLLLACGERHGACLQVWLHRCRRKFCLASWTAPRAGLEQVIRLSWQQANLSCYEVKACIAWSRHARTTHVHDILVLRLVNP